MKRSTKADESAPADSGRIVAIDALRGFDMFWIVGGRELVITFVEIFKKPVPPWLDHQLEHVRWTGTTVWNSFTAWDLIMPLFLFVVGAAMPFSFARRLEQGQSKGQLYAKIIRRTVILFLLGMAVQGHLLDFKLETLHVFANTLQAIAVGYLIAGLVMLNVGIIGQIVFTAAMLIGFWLLLMYVPLTGHGAGSLEEHANVALAVDKFVLGRFIDGTDPPYTWVLSGMTFAASVLLGVFSGHILRSRLAPWGRVAVLTVLGLACLGAGWAWAEWFGFPIIKHIWTSSMVVWAAGWSYLLVALFYTDHRYCRAPPLGVSIHRDWHERDRDLRRVALHSVYRNRQGCCGRVGRAPGLRRPIFDRARSGVDVVAGALRFLSPQDLLTALAQQPTAKRAVGMEARRFIFWRAVPAMSDRH